MSEALRTKTPLLIVIAGILFICTNSMPVANAQHTPTSLTIAVPSPPTEKECTIVATLTDVNGDPLPNMEIDFLFCGSELISSNKTDSNGVASLKLTNDLPLARTPEVTLNYPELNIFKRTETWGIEAKFSGTTNYAPSDSEYLCITFDFLDYTPYQVSGGLGAIIGVVGYVAFRRRKTAITIPETAKEA